MSYVTQWAGPYQTEGLAAFERARQAGMSMLRALALGHVGSFKDCWLFRLNIADKIRGSVRTVGRALQQGRELGLIGTARGKKHEIPPGRTEPVTCGFSHRWTNGWGKSGEVVRQAVEAARAAYEQRRLTRLAMAAVLKPPAPRVAPPRVARGDLRRRWTAADLDAELAKTQPPDKPSG